MRSLILCGALMICGKALAQLPLVDITVVEVADDTLEVRLLPDTSFSGLVAAVTFTLKWDTTGNTHVGAIDQITYGPPFCSLLSTPASNSDGEIDDNGFRYYTINVFGPAPIPGGCAWTTNDEVPLLRLPVIPGTACVNFQIENDAFTFANNKDFFVSLNAVNRTGVIYGPGALDQGDCTTSIATAETLIPPVLWPNPANDQLTVGVGDGKLLGLRILDASGREAMAVNSTNGAPLSLSVSQLPPGAYGVEVRSSTGLSVHRLVIAR